MENDEALDPTTANPAPVMVACETLILPEPVFETVILSAACDPTATLPNAKVAGAAVSAPVDVLGVAGFEEGVVAPVTPTQLDRPIVHSNMPITIISRVQRRVLCASWQPE